MTLASSSLIPGGFPVGVTWANKVFPDCPLAVQFCPIFQNRTSPGTQRRQETMGTRPLLWGGSRCAELRVPQFPSSGLGSGTVWTLGGLVTEH